MPVSKGFGNTIHAPGSTVRAEIYCLTAKSDKVIL